VKGSSIAAVICAAGSSSRMGGIKKEYRLLDSSLSVLGSAVCAFAAVPAVRSIVIAIPPGDEAAARRALPPWVFSEDASWGVGVEKAGFAKPGFEKPSVFFVPGGKTRRDSVHMALFFLAGKNPDYVLIHDGARPWVSVDLIERCIEAVQKYGAVVPAVAFTDTPKEFSAKLWERGGDEGESAVFVKSHLRRASTGAAQTPQAFRFPEILHAHEKAAALEINFQTDFTDDAEIWGKFCGAVAVIPGEVKNRKITFPADLA